MSTGSVDNVLLAYAIHAVASYRNIAGVLNKTDFPPPFGRNWTEAAVAHEYGRLLAEKKLVAK
jgi:hypothetical protein